MNIKYNYVKNSHKNRTEIHKNLQFEVPSVEAVIEAVEAVSDFKSDWWCSSEAANPTAFEYLEIYLQNQNVNLSKLSE